MFWENTFLDNTALRWGIALLVTAGLVIFLGVGEPGIEKGDPEDRLVR